MERMERYKGHFYNWYNTCTLQPCKPRLVSSVDSGNLVGYLIVLKQGINDLLIRQMVGREMLLGLRDTFMIYKTGNSKKTARKMIAKLLDKNQISLIDWSNILQYAKNNVSNLVRNIQPLIEEVGELYHGWYCLQTCRQS